MSVFFFLKLSNSDFLAVQWLGLCTCTSGSPVQSLVPDLRSCKLCAAALAPTPLKNKTKQNKKPKQHWNHPKLYVSFSIFSAGIPKEYIV